MKIQNSKFIISNFLFLLILLAPTKLLSEGGSKIIFAQFQQRPNIIYILADDLGWGDLGCYGQQLIQTPELDQMAAEGMKFTRHYAGWSKCLPSRVTLMTGLHSGHSRVRVNGGGGQHDPIYEEDITAATVMKEAGYLTAMIGKWSLGDDFTGCVVSEHDKDGSGAIYKHGWDYYFGEPNQTYNHGYFLDQLYQYDRYGLIGDQTVGQRLDVIAYPNNSTEKTHYHHDLLTEKVMAFIHAAKDSTFFLYVPYTIPHSDFDIPELEPYAAGESWSDNAKVYASMITRMDRDIGRILDTLAALGLDSNTLVIFTSDNGSNADFSVFDSNGGLEGKKGSESEGGLRVPFIARWPGMIAAGSTSEEVYAFWDMIPTWAELAGINTPSPLDGISMVPALLGQEPVNRHDYLYWEDGNSTYVIKVNDTRSESEIIAEAHTDVVVPDWTPEVTAGCMDQAYEEYNTGATAHEASMCVTLGLEADNTGKATGEVVFNPMRKSILVNLEGNHSLKVRTPDGQLFYTAEGTGSWTYSYTAIAAPGLYVLQLDGMEGKYDISKMAYIE